MIRVLCYGDSNTWGFDPRTQLRFPDEIRWPGVAAAKLGAGFTVIEEGLNGRTTVFDDPFQDGLSGKQYIGPCMRTHQPLDLVVLMLGTNDLKLRYSVPARDVGRGVGVLIRMIVECDTANGGKQPRVLVVAPPPITELSELADVFCGAQSKSRRLASHIAAAADEYGCAFLDAADHVESSRIDGIHFDADAHRIFGDAIAAQVRSLFD